jgi:hypothetical protein
MFCVVLDIGCAILMDLIKKKIMREKRDENIKKVFSHRIQGHILKKIIIHSTKNIRKNYINEKQSIKFFHGRYMLATRNS